jgi:hypothetical protein
MGGRRRVLHSISKKDAGRVVPPAYTRVAKHPLSGLYCTPVVRSFSIACMVLAACEPSATEIIVVTDTDYSVGPVSPQINLIRYEVTHDGETRIAERMIDGPEDLPVSLGIVAGSDLSKPVTVEASGRWRVAGDAPVIEVTREAWFREGESLVLQVYLMNECNRPPCTSMDGCDENGCASRQARDLPPWTGTLPQLPPCDTACCRTCIASDGTCGSGAASQCGRGGAACVACPEGDACTDGVCTGIEFDEVRVFDRGFGLAVTSDGRVRELDTVARTHAEVLELPRDEHFEHAAPGRYEEGTHRRFGCAVAASGRVWCWTPPGEDGASAPWAPLGEVAEIPLPEPAHAIATVRSAACALGRDSGEVYCWGENGEIVQPGDGLPHAVPGVRGASGLVGSHVAVCAFAAEAMCWGSPAAVPVAVPATDDHVPRPLGNFAELAWGANSPTPRFCGRMSGARTISCWSAWGSAEMSDRLDFPQVITRLGVGSAHVCAVTSDGALFCGGLPDAEPTFEPQRVGTAEQRWSDGISSYQGTTCAIDSDRHLWCLQAPGFVPNRVRPEAM